MAQGVRPTGRWAVWAVENRAWPCPARKVDQSGGVASGPASAVGAWAQKPPSRQDLQAATCKNGRRPDHAVLRTASPQSTPSPRPVHGQSATNGPTRPDSPFSSRHVARDFFPPASTGSHGARAAAWIRCELRDTAIAGPARAPQSGEPGPSSSPRIGSIAAASPWLCAHLCLFFVSVFLHQQPPPWA